MLELRNITKVYKVGEIETHALNGVSVAFREKEFAAILGQSGSGKTTALNIIGGLDKYTDGDLIIKGKSTKKFKDKEWDAYRNNSVGFVFQSYNLITHLSIVANVELGMTLSAVPKAKKRQRALEVLKQVGLEEHLHKKPNQLSGGQMQRVAIARALANDPEILLCDEPTGALDTETSIQIMDLIKSLSNDRLVIMVTHNPEIAEEYADRIMRFRDGNIIEDTNPYSAKDSENTFNLKKSAMSFATALKISGTNLMTKKGRTFLTAFASSIGIIAIATVLGLSNGFQLIIDKFQKGAIGDMPIIVMPASQEINREEMAKQHDARSNDGAMYGKVVERNPINEVSVYDPSDLVVTHVNDLGDEYTAFLEDISADVLENIGYGRILSMNFVTDREDGTYSGMTITPVAWDESSGMTSLSSAGLVSYPERRDENNKYFIEKYYEPLYGTFPQNVNDVVLVVDNNGRVPLATMQALGFDINNGETVSFEEIVGMKIKIASNDDWYKSYRSDWFIDIENYPVKKIADQKQEELKESVKDIKNIFTHTPSNAELKAIGVDISLADTDPMQFIESIKNANTDDADEMLAGIIQGIQLELSAGMSAPDISRLPPEEQQAAIVQMQAALTEAAQGIKIALSTPLVDETTLLRLGIDFENSGDDPTAVFMAILGADLNQVPEAAKPVFEAIMDQAGDMLNIDQTAALEELKKQTEDEYQASLKAAFNSEKAYDINVCGVVIMRPDSAMGFLSPGFAFRDGLVNEVLSRNSESAIVKAQQNNKSKNILSGELFNDDSTNASVMVSLNYDTIMQVIGGESKPVFMTLFSTNFDSKDELLSRLDEFNNEAYDKFKNVLVDAGYTGSLPAEEKIYNDFVDQLPKDVQNKVIDKLGLSTDLSKNQKLSREFNAAYYRVVYTDLAGQITAMTGGVMDTITIVLIAFSSISLVVTLIMVAIITYTSVLERIKEIGILRALGARKKDVTRVFDAETFWIGAFSGLLGIAIAYALTIPINIVIEHYTDIVNVAQIAPLHAIGLFILATLLTMIGGHIPAQKASKMDAVEALRSD